MRDIVVRTAPGTLSFLTLLFTGLKLFGAIHWSWWWILSPILAPMALGFIWVVCFGALAIFIAWLRYS